MMCGMCYIRVAMHTYTGASLDHPNIIKFHGVCVRPPAIFIVMELAGTTLHNFLRRYLLHTIQAY